MLSDSLKFYVPNCATRLANAFQQLWKQGRTVETFDEKNNLRELFNYFMAAVGCCALTTRFSKNLGVTPMQVVVITTLVNPRIAQLGIMQHVIRHGALGLVHDFGKRDYIGIAKHLGMIVIGILSDAPIKHYLMEKGYEWLSKPSPKSELRE